MEETHERMAVPKSPWVYNARSNQDKEGLTPPLEKFHLFNLQALHVLHGKTPI